MLTATERLEVEALLKDAKKQKHALLTGKSARVFVDQNGERIEYATANLPRLNAYIYDLETQLGMHPPGARGPMSVWGR